MSEFTSESDQLTPLVSQVLAIQDITWGSSKHAFVVQAKDFAPSKRKTPLKLPARKKPKTRTLEKTFPLCSDYDAYIRIDFKRKDDTVTITSLDIRVALSALTAKE